MEHFCVIWVGLKWNKGDKTRTNLQLSGKSRYAKTWVEQGRNGSNAIIIYQWLVSKCLTVYFVFDVCLCELSMYVLWLLLLFLLFCCCVAVVMRQETWGSCAINISFRLFRSSVEKRLCDRLDVFLYRILNDKVTRNVIFYVFFFFCLQWNTSLVKLISESIEYFQWILEKNNNEKIVHNQS